MDIKNESHWQIGEIAKTKRNQIRELNDVINALENKLADTNTCIGKYRMDLNDSIATNNEIASKKIHVRILEEEIYQCELQRKRIENDFIYMLRLSINDFSGTIEFYCRTKGKGQELTFSYDGKKLTQVGFLENINESSWAKYGQKSIKQSVVKFFDRQYILHENGDFISLAYDKDKDDYNADDIIGNVLKRTF